MIHLMHTNFRTTNTLVLYGNVRLPIEQVSQAYLIFEVHQSPLQKNLAHFVTRLWLPHQQGLHCPSPRTLSLDAHRWLSSRTFDATSEEPQFFSGALSCDRLRLYFLRLHSVLGRELRLSNQADTARSSGGACLCTTVATFLAPHLSAIL